MPTVPTCAARARRASERVGRALALGIAAATLAACAVLTGPDAGAPPPPRAEAAQAAAAASQPPRMAQALDDAVASLTDALLAKAGPPPSGGGRRVLVIDPLIERATEVQTVATQSIGAKIEERVRDRHPQFEVRPLTTASLAEQPLIVLGSMAGVAEAGSLRPAAVGQPRVWRIWAALADLRTDRILAREMVWVRAEDVEPTPTAFFRDSPVWSPDPVAAAYLRTCSSTAGTPIDPVYRQALLAQALIAEAVEDYDARRYREALDGYSQALRLPGGEQLRAFNGVYLAHWVLGRRRGAEAAFARLVDYGLRQDRLAVKLLFRPGSTAFWDDPALTRPYPMWLRQIARRADERTACLRVTGHTSVTGPAELNDRLSLARAERVRTLLAAERPPMRERTLAEGLGSRQPIVGIGTDDAADALDRRVEFRPLPCRTLSAGAAGVAPGGS